MSGNAIATGQEIRTQSQNYRLLEAGSMTYVRISCSSF
jgi:hypothetical protein